MCKIEGTKTYKIGGIAFNSSSFIGFSANIEQVPHENSFYFKEAIYMEAKKSVGGNVKKYEDRGIGVLFSSLELRALAYAIKEIVKTPINANGQKNIEYEKFSSSDTIKKVFLGFSNQKYYINVHAGKRGDDGHKEVSVSSDKYKLLAFADKLIILAEETEREFFKYERFKDKYIRKQINKQG